MHKSLNKYLFLGLILGITYFLWIFTIIFVQKDFDFEYILKYLSQLFAITAVIFLSLNFILATRIKFIENIFNGLDKMYKWHKVFARVGFSLAWLHPILLMVFNFVGIDSLRLYFLPGDFLNYNAGILTLYTLTILVLITFVKFIPYNIWKHTHRFMILVLIFLGVHIATTNSTVSYNAVLKFWLLTFVFLGILSFIYIEVFYKKSGFLYKVSKINVLGSITEIYLEPFNKPLRFLAGQFIFLSVLNNSKISKELHPFTISSNPNEYAIRISSKNLGDYTSTLNNLKVEDSVRLIGPYGHFNNEKFLGFKNQIWIAGGIGITPFLSMLAKEKDNNSLNNISFFYSVKNENDLVYKMEILDNSNGIKNVSVNFNIDSENGFLTAQKILKESKFTNSDCVILICGPKPMMYSLKEQFLSLGVPKKNIVFEDFALKPV